MDPKMRPKQYLVFGGDPVVGRIFTAIAEVVRDTRNKKRRVSLKVIMIRLDDKSEEMQYEVVEVLRNLEADKLLIRPVEGATDEPDEFCACNVVSTVYDHDVAFVLCDDPGHTPLTKFEERIAMKIMELRGRSLSGGFLPWLKELMWSGRLGVKQSESAESIAQRLERFGYFATASDGSANVPLSLFYRPVQDHLLSKVPDMPTHSGPRVVVAKIEKPGLLDLVEELGAGLAQGVREMSSSELGEMRSVLRRDF